MSEGHAADSGEQHVEKVLEFPHVDVMLSCISAEVDHGLEKRVEHRDAESIDKNQHEDALGGALLLHLGWLRELCLVG